MLISKLPLLEQTTSQKILFNKTKLIQENSNCAGLEKTCRQTNALKAKRQLSIMKQFIECKKQITTQNDESISKRGHVTKSQSDCMIIEKLQQEFEQKYQEQVKISEDLKLENVKLKMQLDEQEQQIIYLKLLNNDLRYQIENSTLAQQLKKLESEYKDTYRRMDDTLRKAIDENYESQIKMKNLSIKSQQLEQFTVSVTIMNQFSLRQQLTCKLCRKELQNTITVIPCAHNYCQRCVSGYVGRCFACNDDSVVQATYHNEYIGDLINMYKIFENIMNILKT
ncbi:unnamed protein product (macronuclear) [Paramecium tetraurelia]|uniref:RING-type domain-containing protein n=1 Tax=Paramecium tetraurelia TaxID=5888 RepID=A0CEM8_PARTE|nr:uncharacterized protein GSPATT00037684001 [Paramecium tetraurelia]CAK69245.1 unnamed protein product [Paramecium tetraurelia]|eukprot:XP_001436642.1 hypothetical protein (macronuclear) [Paramecium tetraurelia strain d4-2]